MNWLVVGSSPLVRESLSRVSGAYRTITTNRGISLVWPPDVYFLVDILACRLFIDKARAAAACGTHCVTLNRELSGLQSRRLDWFAEFVDPSMYQPFLSSGLFCVEYACRKGAELIALVGMDGYGGDTAYFDGTPMSRGSRDKTEQQIQPRMNWLCEEFSGVEFVCYGSPSYQVTASNWSVA